MSEWTRPYHGVTHLDPGGYPRARRWATLNILSNGIVILKMWDRWSGIPFSPEQRSFYDVEKAKRAGERWVRSHV